MAAFFSPGITEEEFARLYQDISPKIFRHLYALLGDAMEAEDILSETFIKLWVRPPLITTNLAGWLYRVAIREAYNLQRQDRRRGDREVKQFLLDLPESAEPAEEVESREQQERARLTLKRLKEKEAQLLLFHQDGASYKEMAALVGIPASSVGKSLSRAQEKFRRLYQQAQGENDDPS